MTTTFNWRFGKTRSTLGFSDRTPRVLAAGGILAAIGIGACCVAPFALFMLGVSGAWIGNLTALKPYQPIFIGFALATVGLGFYLTYRKPLIECSDRSPCADPRSGRRSRAALWIATALVAAALSFPYAVRLFLDA